MLGLLHPPSTLCPPPTTVHVPLHSKFYVKIWHLRLGGANTMHPLSWGKWHKRKNSKHCLNWYEMNFVFSSFQKTVKVFGF